MSSCFSKIHTRVCEIYKMSCSSAHLLYNRPSGRTAERRTPFFINSHTRVGVCILRKGCPPVRPFSPLLGPVKGFARSSVQRTVVEQSEGVFLPSPYVSIPRPSRDHYGRLRHVSFLSFFLPSLSPSRFLPLPPPIPASVYIL